MNKLYIVVTERYMGSSPEVYLEVGNQKDHAEIVKMVEEGPELSLGEGAVARVYVTDLKHVGTFVGHTASRCIESEKYVAAARVA